MNYTSYTPQKYNKAPKHRFAKKFFLFAVTALLVLAVDLGLHIHDARHSASASSISSAISSSLNPELQTIILANPQVQIGVATIDLSDNKLSTYGQTTPFVAASTTKLITAADFLHEVEEGQYSLNGDLGVSTASWQLQEMVQQSDDDSWSLFINLLGGQQIEDYAHQIGLSSFEFSNNTIAPADEALLLQKLYEGQLLNKADTKLLLSYMQNTNDETLIPAALPKGATVYHKYGELLDTDDDDDGNYVHDVAIINYKGHSFVLAIYTNRSDMLDITTRQTIIHEITQKVVKAETS